jgi:hypothetical protein
MLKDHGEMIAGAADVERLGSPEWAAQGRRLARREGGLSDIGSFAMRGWRRSYADAMAKREAARLSVWRWSGRDRVSLHDLEYLVAANSRPEWRQTVLRVRLPDWKQAGMLKDSDPRFALAAAEPGHVFWRELGDGTEWRDEAELEELRRTSTLRELSAGRYSEPVHRSEPR